MSAANLSCINPAAFRHCLSSLGVGTILASQFGQCRDERAWRRFIDIELADRRVTDKWVLNSRWRDAIARHLGAGQNRRVSEGLGKRSGVPRLRSG